MKKQNMAPFIQEEKQLLLRVTLMMYLITDYTTITLNKQFFLGNIFGHRS